MVFSVRVIIPSARARGKKRQSDSFICLRSSKPRSKDRYDSTDIDSPDYRPQFFKGDGDVRI